MSAWEVWGGILCTAFGLLAILLLYLWAQNWIKSEKNGKRPGPRDRK